MRSTYASIIPQAKPIVITWKYTAESIASGIRLEARDIDDSLSAGTELFFNADGKLHEAVVTRQVMGKARHISRQFATDAPAIFPDSSAPADWLNISPQQTRNLPATLKTRTQHTKNLAVSQNLRVTQQTVTVDQALAQGMLDQGFKDTLKEPLALFLVMRQQQGSETEILRQLWAPGDFWWLYESTGSRTSLRLAD